MAKTLEELKQIGLNEQEIALMIKAQQQQQLSLMEQRALEQLRARLSDDEGMDELPPVEMLQKLHKPNLSFEPQSVNENVLVQIIADFEAQFGKENHKNGILCFSSYDEVNDFFQKQANKGHAFLMQEQNKDNYVFSDGKGHYLMGSKAAINSYCEKNSLKSPFSPEKSPELDYSPVMTH